MRFRTTVRFLTAALALAVAGSCADAPTAPPSVTPEASPDSVASLFGLFGPRALRCHTSETQTTTTVLDAAGGMLSVAGTKVLVPLGALLGPTTVTLTVPASNVMEIDVSVEGTDHFVFQLPITVTVSYAHCGSTLWTRLLPLNAWHWDSDTGKFLERMPSIDNKLARTVTFTTPHLSGYIIAN
jgi:hypothetical protein